MLLDFLPNLYLTELVSITMKVRNKSKKVFPNESQLKELRSILLVDQMIYEHFNQKLEKWWTSRDNHRIMDIKKKGLTCLNKWASTNLETTMDSHPYTKYLWKKLTQNQKKI